MMSELQHKDPPENVDPWLQRELLHEFTIFEIKHFKGQSGSNLLLALVLFLVTFREFLVFFNFFFNGK